MARNVETETTIIKDVGVGSRGAVIRVSRVKYPKTGTETLDIRKFDFDKEDKLAPTYKGISITSEVLPEVLKAVILGLSTEERIDLLAELSDLDELQTN